MKKRIIEKETTRSIFIESDLPQKNDAKTRLNNVKIEQNDKNIKRNIFLLNIKLFLNFIDIYLVMKF
jgi:hypothetical protein